MPILTDNDDTYTGDGGANFITAFAGDDWLSGAGGADFISPGSGYETVYGGAGNDSIGVDAVFSFANGSTITIQDITLTADNLLFA